MRYEFQVLRKILPKLNSIHVPSNEPIQLVARTLLQSLERFFSDRRTRSIIAVINHFFQGQV